MVLVVLQYGDYSNLGVRAAIGREIPFQIGAGNELKARTVARDSFGFNMGSGLLVALGLFLFSFFLPNPQGPLRWGLRIGALLLLLQQWSTFYTILNRSYRRFDVFGTAHILKGILTLGLQAGLAWLFGFQGLLAGAFLVQCLLILYLRSQLAFPLGWSWHWPAIRPLLRLGLPFLLIGLSDLAFVTADRILISSFLDLTAVGYYSIGIFAFGLLSFVPNVVSTTMYPRLCEDAGAENRGSDLTAHLRTPNHVISCLQGWICGNTLLAIPFFVPLLLPRFVPGIDSAMILCAGAFFAALTPMAGNLMTAVGKVWHYQATLLATSFAGILLVFFFLFSGRGIAGVALAVLIGHAFRFLLFTAYAYRIIAKKLTGLLEIFWSSLYPALWCGLVWAFVFIGAARFGDGLSSFLLFLLEIIAYNIAVVPLILRLLRKHQVISSLSAGLKSRFLRAKTI